MTEPKPDPGNSPPEDWAEDLDPAEVEQIRGGQVAETGGQLRITSATAAAYYGTP